MTTYSTYHLFRTAADVRVGDFLCMPADKPWMSQRRILSVDIDGDQIRITYEGLGGVGEPKAIIADDGMRFLRGDITGRHAIELAEALGIDRVYCYGNPIDDGGMVDLDTARQICDEDPSLIVLRTNEVSR